ncbi:MAG TPA: multifunctional CCA addition/repair protein [Piscirickettsiaceae bacterium]|nr:multifunctional CCA addition/repair protein [Piscirickettsiaceae bacterium]HIQ40832.1 multifunctional CCA addition/repair protein [Sulfurivirga caldicuralii]
MEPKIYLVGGAVRDRLLELPVKEKDWVVVGATPEWMIQQGYQPVGKDFPVFLHPHTREEYALARTERKQGRGYHGFVFHAGTDVSLEADLCRRDLTVNAMAQDLDTGEIIDPYGGQEDLQQRVLRHVSDAFAEDPLRVLRVARFAAKLAPLGFKVAPETLVLMRRMSTSGELDALTSERVWKEVDKALRTQAPHVFFQLLHEVEALNVLFPEIAALDGVPQSPKWHPEGDVLTHTWLVLMRAAELHDDVAVRFAALVHDVGKGLTPKKNWPHHPGHEAAGVPLVEALCQRYRVPNAVREVAVKATRWHGHFHKGPEGKLSAEEILQMVQAIDLFRKPQLFFDLLDVAEADYRGRTGYALKPYPHRSWWVSLAEALRAISPKGFVAQGLKGAEIGEAVRQARLEVIRCYLDKI